ncbi:N-6 DNA methylase [bacterium]|nr:N-6 DNA methylase [bacterium]
MSDSDTAFRRYVSAINEALRTGRTTEHTHRAALIELLKSLDSSITVINEPGRIRDGSPDILVRNGEAILGYVETKDIGIDLANWPRSEQGKRYLATFENLILTDYVSFQWFVEGEKRIESELGYVSDGKIASTQGGRALVLQLLTDFLAHKPEGIGTADELARRMAAKARGIKELIIEELKYEKEDDHLQSQLEIFRETLLPNLRESQFADMYAQTLAYGLFAARVEQYQREPGKEFSLDTASNFVPKTNPLLRKLFHHYSFELREKGKVVWLVEDLVQLFANCDLAEITRDFGVKMGRADPVVDLYETFLKHYNPKERERRGVYYTPEPVVSYIVRSIDRILQTEFGKEDGLADRDVLILDPAVGTGTFLYYAVKLIRERVEKKLGKGAWRSYVRKDLLRRLFGFELLMAPYVICHLKLGMQLEESGYEFADDERLSIYLTNALEEDIPKTTRTARIFGAQEIVEEAEKADSVKRKKPIWVVMGNPPYSAHSANASWKLVPVEGKRKPQRRRTFIGELLNDYCSVDGKPLAERKTTLQDDYVKFIRFAQWRIERTGHGVVGMITNHSWLDNPTFRGMRQQLMQAFDKIHTLDLHGNVQRKERAPNGCKDENVFDIQQGVAIILMVKQEDEDKSGTKVVSHAELWGKAGKEEYPPPDDTKYAELNRGCIANTKWNEIHPECPFYLFRPVDFALEPEYKKAWQVSHIFSSHVCGILTSSDHFVFDFDYRALEQKLERFRDLEIPDAQIQKAFQLAQRITSNLTTFRKDYALYPHWKDDITTCLSAPFDTRWLAYTDMLVWRTRLAVMRHMLTGQNLALLTTRITKDPFSAFATDTIARHKSASRFDMSHVFPLYLYYQNDTELPEPKPNLNPEFVGEFEQKLGIHEGSLEARQIFNYIYAILHSPTYRKRYEEFLKVDFPRIPFTSDEDLFRQLAKLGGELIELHLLRHPDLELPIAKFPVQGDDVVRNARYHEVSRRVYINETQYFEGVKKKHWDFYIGGYQVLRKWLKDREKVNRKLTDDIETYCKIVTAIDETIRLMKLIDLAIPDWPIE